MPAVNRNVLGQALDDAQDVWLVLPEHFARTQAAQRRQEVLERRAREQVRGMQRPHLLQMIPSTCRSTTNYLKLASLPTTISKHIVSSFYILKGAVKVKHHAA